MNTAYLEAFMLGYLKAAFKEHLRSMSYSPKPHALLSAQKRYEIQVNRKTNSPT